MNPSYKHSSFFQSAFSFLLISNYSLASFFSDWRVEKKFPRAVFLTSFQAYLWCSALLIAFYPVVKSTDQLLVFLIVISILTFLFLFYFGKLVEEMFKKWHILYHYKKEVEIGGAITSSIVMTTVALILFATAFFWRALGYLQS